MTTRRCAIFGTGDIAGSHVGAIKANPGLELVAAYNRSAPRLADFAATNGLDASATYTDYQQLLDEVKPDLVFICTPPGLHAEQSIAAMRAGADVICEKPPTLTLAEFDEVQAVADETGHFWAITYQQRAGEALAYVKHLIDSGEVGPVTFATFNTTWWRDDAYYEVGWRGTWESEGGGTIMAHGIHKLDMIAHLFGTWTSVRAVLRNQMRPTILEDLAAAIITFESGAVVFFVSDTVSPRGESYVRIDTARASIESTHLYAHESKDWTITSAPDVEASWTMPDDAVSTDVTDDGPHPGWKPGAHAELVGEVIAAADAGEPVPFTGASARAAMELATAMYAAAVTDRTIYPADIEAGTAFYDRIIGEAAEDFLVAGK